MAEDAGRRRPHRRRPAAARHQPRLARAGDRRLALLRLRARRRARPTPTWPARHAEVFLEVLEGEGFAQPNPRPMFPNPPGLLRLEPHSRGPARAHLVGRGVERDRGLGGEARHEPAELDAEERRDRRAVPRPAGRSRSAPIREAWKEAGHSAQPRVSVSRSIFALVDDRDRAYFGRGGTEQRPDRLHRREHAGDLRPLATPPSPTCSSSSSPRTRRSPRPTRCC